jgi:Fis family transcriptional regulator
MQRYFEDLDGQDTKELYDIVMAEVEPPLIEAAMKYTRQNQSKTCRTFRLKSWHVAQKIKTVQPSLKSED